MYGVHGLWIQVMQETLLLFVQAILVTGTWLLHRMTKNVEQMIQVHMASLENVLTNFDIQKRPE